MRLLIPLLVAVSLLVPAVSQAGPKERIAKLREQNAQLRYDVRYLTRERDKATRERDRALKGLPDAIRAVQRDDFLRLVIRPALDIWACDSFFQTGTYWKADFEFYENSC